MTRDSGATVYQGTYGHWWSQGADSNTDARYLGIGGNYTSPESNDYKTRGFSVRCDQGSTRVNDILHQFPFSLPYSGTVGKTDGKVYYQGTDGYWWSAGSDSATYARYLSIGGNSTYPENSYYKTFGGSVRCVVVKFTTLLSVITCKISCLSL